MSFEKDAREIKIGNNIVLIDEDERILNWVNLFNWGVSTESQNKYAVTTLHAVFGAKKVRMHQLIMHVVLGHQMRKGTCIDHINYNGLDNRICNLRIITHAQNVRRSRPKLGLKYKGIYFTRNRYRAMITHNGKSIHIGTFKTEIEAAHAYDKVARAMHGEFAYLNFKEDLAT